MAPEDRWEHPSAQVGIGSGVMAVGRGVLVGGDRCIRRCYLVYWSVAPVVGGTGVLRRWYRCMGRRHRVLGGTRRVGRWYRSRRFFGLRWRWGWRLSWSESWAGSRGPRWNWGELMAEGGGAGGGGTKLAMSSAVSLTTSETTQTPGNVQATESGAFWLNTARMLFCSARMPSSRAAKS